MLTIVPRYLHLDLAKHVMRNVSRLRLRAHTLKVEAAVWHEDGSFVCDQCPGEDEHVQNEDIGAEETLFLSVFTFF